MSNKQSAEMKAAFFGIGMKIEGSDIEQIHKMVDEANLVGANACWQDVLSYYHPITPDSAVESLKKMEATL